MKAECFITATGTLAEDVSTTIIVGTEIGTATSAMTGTTAGTVIAIRVLNLKSFMGRALLPGSFLRPL